MKRTTIIAQAALLGVASACGGARPAPADPFAAARAALRGGGERAGLVLEHALRRRATRLVYLDQPGPGETLWYYHAVRARSSCLRPAGPPAGRPRRATHRAGQPDLPGCSTSIARPTATRCRSASPATIGRFLRRLPTGR
jgi:hypothetical protein